MKKVLILLAICVLAVYGTAAATLSASGANHFINELEALSLAGKADEYCARLHVNATVSIRDRTAPDFPRDIDGGKKELCDYVTFAMKGVDLLGIRSEATRADFTVNRSWLHPWIADVSYSEKRTTQMSKSHVTLNTASEDHWTLVQTFNGVKVMRLSSVARVVE